MFQLPNTQMFDCNVKKSSLVSAPPTVQNTYIIDERIIFSIGTLDISNTGFEMPTLLTLPKGL